MGAKLSAVVAAFSLVFVSAGCSSTPDSPEDAASIVAEAEPEDLADESAEAEESVEQEPTAPLDLLLLISTKCSLYELTLSIYLGEDERHDTPRGQENLNFLFSATDDLVSAARDAYDQVHGPSTRFGGGGNLEPFGQLHDTASKAHSRLREIKGEETHSWFMEPSWVGTPRLEALSKECQGYL